MTPAERKRAMARERKRRERERKRRGESKLSVPMKHKDLETILYAALETGVLTDEESRDSEKVERLAADVVLQWAIETLKKCRHA